MKFGKIGSQNAWKGLEMNEESLVKLQYLNDLVVRRDKLLKAIVSLEAKKKQVTDIEVEIMASLSEPDSIKLLSALIEVVSLQIA